MIKFILKKFNLNLYIFKYILLLNFQLVNCSKFKIKFKKLTEFLFLIISEVIK